MHAVLEFFDRADLFDFRSSVEGRGEEFTLRTGKRADMATIIEFPTEAASRRLGLPLDGTHTGTILILPVVRIERDLDGQSGGSGPEEGKSQGRPRRRR
jgi:hypothetical protein